MAVLAGIHSPRTEEAYCDWVRRFVLYHERRHPAAMGETEVSAFLTHLATDRHVAASTQNQALHAILGRMQSSPQNQN